MKNLDQPKSEIEQLAEVFGLTTGRFLEACQNKAELSRAAGERDELIKEQIKAEVVRQTRAIFAHNFKRITGSEPWDEAQGENRG